MMQAINGRLGASGLCIPCLLPTHVLCLSLASQDTCADVGCISTLVDNKNSANHRIIQVKWRLHTRTCMQVIWAFGPSVLRLFGNSPPTPKWFHSAANMDGCGWPPLGLEVGCWVGKTVEPRRATHPRPVVGQECRPCTAPCTLWELGSNSTPMAEALHEGAEAQEACCLAHGAVHAKACAAPKLLTGWWAP